MDDKFSTLTELQLRSLARRIAYGRNDEAATIATIELMLHGGSLARAWLLPPIAGWVFEHPVDGGRIDLVLMHVDGSTSLVEVKGDVPACDIARGIGQLFYYAAVYRKPARLILCSGAPVAKAFNAIGACRLAGIQYGFLPCYDETRILTADLRDGALL